MTTWSSFRAAVEAAVLAALPSTVRTPSNNDGPVVFWDDGADPYAKHKVQLTEVSTVLEQDRDSALDTGGEQVLSSLVAITVQVQAESIHDDPTLNANWLIEQVRLGLRKVSVRAALHAANVVIAEFPGATTRRSYPADGHRISAASFDITFRTEFTFDPEGEDAGLIEHVTVEGEGDEDAIDEVELTVDDPDPEP